MKHFMNATHAASLGDEVIFNYIEGYGPDYSGLHVAKADISPAGQEVMIGYYFEPKSPMVEQFGELPGLVISLGSITDSAFVSEPLDVSLEQADRIFDQLSQVQSEEEFDKLSKQFGLTYTTT